MEKKFEPIRAPARVLQVLNEIALSAGGLTLTRLVALTGLPKTSVLSLLRSLEASNYVINVSGAYCLGKASFAVAAAIVAHERFLPSARPIMQRLYEATGETVQISVLAPDEPAAQSIDVIETPRPIRLTFPVGLRRPLYCSSAGKLLLAFQPRQWIDDYLSRTPLVPYTPHTVTDAGRLRDELARIRRDGWCVSHQGMFEDSSGLSAAIWQSRGRMIGAVSVLAPTYRVQRDEQRILRGVIDAGNRISRELGYEGAYPPADDIGD
ncbi:MAG: IclR family transcriptional regulator [Burkholderiaceae bacterium]